MLIRKITQPLVSHGNGHSIAAEPAPRHKPLCREKTQVFLTYSVYWGLDEIDLFGRQLDELLQLLFIFTGNDHLLSRCIISAPGAGGNERRTTL